MTPTDFRFCPRCGQPLVEQAAFGRLRPVCAACGFVQFRDPKVAAAVLLSHNGQVLLIRRAVDPGAACGRCRPASSRSMSCPNEAAAREALEETGLHVAIGDLLRIRLMTNPDKPGLLLTYRGQVIGGDLQANDDVSEARWFSADEIPWDELAFETTRESLRDWLAATTDR